MRQRWVFVVVGALVTAGLVAAVMGGGALAEQASGPGAPAAGQLDAGEYHSCATLIDGTVRCWGLGSSGQLGYGTTSNVGDGDTPASVGPVNFGPGITVKAIAAGGFHTCAILNDGSVRCWGFGGDGRLGYGNTNNVLDPSTIGPVDLGGQTVTAITAGVSHTCAIREDGSVVCWGFGGAGHTAGGYGRLGYGNENDVGATPTTTPGLIGPVDIGIGRTARAISAGGAHTCVIRDDGSVLCWGLNSSGQLGYGNTTNVGDTPPSPAPSAVGPVDLGGQKALAISAGGAHTCAIVVGGSVWCWGQGVSGQLGYGTTNNVGGGPPDQSVASAGPVALGGHAAVAISAGDIHTCAILDDGSVRCWGYGTYGRLGYPTLDSFGNQANILAPLSTPVDLGAGRTALAISAGGEHTCALLDDHSVRCWGFGGYGQLGYCSTSSVGETNPPGSVGPVNLMPGDGGATCPAGGGATTTAPTTTAPTTTTPTTTTPSGGKPPPSELALALRAQAARAKALRVCLRKVTQRPKRDRVRARAVCLRRYRRIPGPVTHLAARAVSRTAIKLSFAATGTDGLKPPAAHTYLIEQSSSPIRSRRDFAAAQPLCNRRCRFNVILVGTKLTLKITHLQPGQTYYYAIEALDNVTGTAGPRSAAVHARTR